MWPDAPLIKRNGEGEYFEGKVQAKAAIGLVSLVLPVLEGI